MRLLAGRILRQRDPSAQDPGKNWVARFLARNSSLKLQKAKALEAVRANSMSPAAINHFFDELERITDTLDIQQSNVWNMDEHGLMIGQQNAHNVVSPSDQVPSIVSAQTREWVSIIECVGARGNARRPVVIFKGEMYRRHGFLVLQRSLAGRMSPLQRAGLRTISV